MKNALKQARIYGRFSSKPQERGDSYRQQVEGAKEYAKRNGIEIIAEPYFDKGVSGKAGANLEKELGRYLRDAKAGEILLVYIQDRFGRQNPILLTALIYEICLKGIEIHVWGENKIINQANMQEMGGQISTFIASATGFQENQRKIQRANDTNAATLVQASKGIPTRNLLKYLPSSYYWNEATSQFDYDKEKAKTIRRIFLEFINDGHGTTTIAKNLNNENVPTLYNWNKKGKWQPITVKQILKNESYAGVCHTGNHKITCFPPIITRDVFNKAQLCLARYNKRHGNHSKKGRVNNIFPFIIRCHKCNGNLRIPITNDKKRRFPTYSYQCANYKLGICDVKKMRSTKPIEVLTMASLTGGAGESLQNFSHNPHVAQVEDIEVKIQKIKAGMENLLDLVEAGDEGAKARIAKRREELKTLDAELKKINLENKDLAGVPALIEEIAGMFKAGDKEKTKQAMENYFVNIWHKLQDNELRKRLYSITPSLIDHIAVDLVGNRFNITKKDKKAMGWVDIAEFTKKIKASNVKWL